MWRPPMLVDIAQPPKEQKNLGEATLLNSPPRMTGLLWTKNKKKIMNMDERTMLEV